MEKRLTEQRISCYRKLDKPDKNPLEHFVLAYIDLVFATLAGTGKNRLMCDALSEPMVFFSCLAIYFLELLSLMEQKLKKGNQSCSDSISPLVLLLPGNSNDKCQPFRCHWSLDPS